MPAPGLAGYRPDADRYDEMVDDAGHVRARYAALSPAFGRTATAPPLLLDEREWRLIESGIAQRARLLETVLADAYGAQLLCRDGIVPAAALTRSADFLRPLLGISPAGGRHLLVYAADLGRDRGGMWRVLRDRTQAPTGFGNTVQSRKATLQAFADVAVHLDICEIEHFFHTLNGTLRGNGRDGNVCVWTPGPFSENFSEHQMLARLLSLRLVEGGDLLVQGSQLFVRTIAGLEPIHAVLRRLDGDFADPLTLNARSRLGVPGLTQVIRAGNVVIANSLGAGLAESRSLAPYLDAIARHLMREKLSLQLGDVTEAASTMPVWDGTKISPRPVTLRVFAVSTPDGWQVMRGGVAQLGDRSRTVAADVWVLDRAYRKPPPCILAAGSCKQLTSRVADHLFWFGRYFERAVGVALVLQALETRLVTEMPAAGWSETLDLAQLLGAWGAAPYADRRVAAAIASSAHDYVGSLPWLLNAARLNANCIAGELLPQAVADDLADLINAIRIRTIEQRAVTIDRLQAMQVALASHRRDDHATAFLQIGRHVERAIIGCRLAERYAIGPASQIAGADALALEIRRGDVQSRATAPSSLFDRLIGAVTAPTSIAFDIEVLRTASSALPAIAHADQDVVAACNTTAGLAINIIDKTSAEALLPLLESKLIGFGDLVSSAYLTRRDPTPAVLGAAPR